MADTHTSSWPFESVPRERFEALSERAKGAIEFVLQREITFAEREQLAAYRSREARLQKAKAITPLRVVGGTDLEVTHV